MKKVFLFFGFLALIVACNKDNPKPGIEEKPDIFYNKLDSEIIFIIPNYNNFRDLEFVEVVDNDTLVDSIKFEIIHSYDEGAIDCDPYVDQVYLYFVNHNIASEVKNWDEPFPLADSSTVDADIPFCNRLMTYFDIRCISGISNYTKIEEYKDCKYGLQLFRNGLTYYGWVRIKMENNVITIVEYAYRTEPDKAIKCGQKE